MVGAMFNLSLTTLTSPVYVVNSDHTLVSANPTLGFKIDASKTVHCVAGGRRISGLLSQIKTSRFIVSLGYTLYESR